MSCILMSKVAFALTISIGCETAFMEFHKIDPRSTAFRCHDVEPQGRRELWFISST
ncbi:MAG: hypothetical protein WA003_09980 [Desulfuromonadaceae bacterium]